MYGDIYRNDVELRNEDYIDGLGHKPFKSGQAFFSER